MIKRADYLRYHKLLLQEIRDEDLFEEMASDALETAHKILENSAHILYPSDGYECDCGCCAEWNGRNDTWYCKHCGRTYNWHELYEEESLYTEQTGKLVNIIGHLEYGNKDREAWFEILLQFVHGSGPMARYYIEGGCRTLSEVTLDQTNLERVFWAREPACG